MEGPVHETVTNRDGEEEQQDSFNSVLSCADSGARGSRRRSASWPVCAVLMAQARRLDHRDADYGELP